MAGFVYVHKPDEVNASNLKAVKSLLCLSLSLPPSLFCACELRRLIRGLSCSSISGRGRESLMPGKVAHKGNRAMAEIREDVETLQYRQLKQPASQMLKSIRRPP